MNGVYDGNSLGKYINEFIIDSWKDQWDLSKDAEYSWILEYKKLGEEEFLKKHLFVENDQVVVPSLNLKSAKEIFCKNEKQKKALRKMGFIEDRIKIKNIKYPFGL